MIKNSFPITPGIGDDTDLEVKIHKSGQKWFPQIHSGYFYLNAQENYLYASEGYEDITVSAGLTTEFTLTSTTNFKEASRNGPIIIDGETFRWARVGANFTAYNAATPNPSGSNLLYIGVQGQLVIVTQNDGTDMIQVPTIDFLTERNFYYFDQANRLLWINRDPNDPDRLETLYISYLQDTPTLLQEEIIIVDSDNKVRVMLDKVVNDIGYEPIIYVPGIGSITCTATRNVLTPTTDITPGTKVAARYYVDGSFLLTSNDSNPPYGTTLSLYRSVTEKATIRWETTCYSPYFDTGIFKDSDLSYIQLNSLYTGISPGFVYLSSPRLPEETLDSLRIRVSPLRVSGQIRETVRISIKALDVSNRGIPKVFVDCWLKNNNDSSIIYKPICADIDTPINNKTDFNGEKHFLWSTKPQALGNYTVYASAMTVSGTIIDTHPLIVSQALLFTDIANAPKVNLYLSPNKGPDGLQDLYVYLTTQTGIPYQPNLKVSIHCKKGLLYQISSYSGSANILGSQDLVVNFDKNNLSGVRVTTCRYQYSSGDSIIAKPISNTDDPDPTNWVLIGYSIESVPLLVDSILGVE